MLSHQLKSLKERFSQDGGIRLPTQCDHLSGGTKHKGFGNLNQLYFPFFLKIFYDENMFTLLSSCHKSVKICHDTKKQVRVFQGGFITAQPIKFSMQLGTTFYLSFITLTFFLSEII